MKTIMLTRHGKADPLVNPDSQRRLTERGRAQAQSIGRQLHASELDPDVIFCSPAVRARETAQQMVAGYAWEIMVDPTLYVGGAEDYWMLLQRARNTYNRCMILGHNPSLEELIFMLAGVTTTMKSGYTAVLEADIEYWRDLSHTITVNLTRVIEP